MPSAVVLAGGRSTRFGAGDKALTDLAGTPMIRRVADRLGPAVSTLVVNCRTDQRDPIASALQGYTHEVRFGIDPMPDLGPVAGIRTGLRDVADEYAAVVACDMPFVDPALVSYLFDRAAGHDAALPRVGEWLQPTQAVYRTDAMAEACDRELARDEGSVLATVEELDRVVVEESTLCEHGWLGSFVNVNTRGELRDAETRLQGTR